MSIVKMKRLRVIGMQAEREELLRLLQRLGCVEIREPGPQDDPVWQTLSRPDPAALTEARQVQGELQAALAALKKYGPKAKGGLLKARPEVRASEFFDEAVYRQTLEDARGINELDRAVNALYAEQNKLSTQKLTLAPWLELDTPLEVSATRTVNVSFCAVPAAVNLEEIRGALAQDAPLAELLEAGADRELRYFVLMCHKSQEEAAGEVLKGFGYSRITFRGLTGTAAENDKRLDEELALRRDEASENVLRIAAFAPRREALQQALDRANQEIAREEAKSRLLESGQTFYFEGWAPAVELGGLEQTLSRFTCCWETADPTEEEYPQVPVKLKNNTLTRPLNMVTEMYALPAYNGVDPNPLMAPFFILFYGIMMADMGYGLLMMIASVVFLRKAKPKGGMRHFAGLLGLCGISTFVMGAITGGFFGDFLTQVVLLTTGREFVLPSLFNPLDDALMVLLGSMALGVVQIVTGMAISFVTKVRRGEVMAALCNEGAWFLVFVLIGVGAATGAWIPAMIAVGVLLVLTQGYGKKGIVGKLMGLLGSLYNNITGYFSDILSYSRLMALMLAGAVIAQVFNTLGAITGNIFTFILISVVGNALNFGLNLLGCYVHDLRLQCLEYFGRFYEDGGIPFAPLSVQTKYVDITE